MALIAYKGDSKLKSDFLTEVKKHEEIDAIKQGTYGIQNGTWKGCAVACSLRSLAIVKGEELVTEYSQHDRYETDLGIPRIIARLEDRIFEGLSVQESKKFPYEFASAVNVGAELSLVWPKFAVWLLIDEKDGVLQYAKAEKSLAAIKRVAKLYQNQIDGTVVNKKDWKDAAADAADAAADAAAYAAAYAATDADAAAYAAAYAATDADAAAYAAAYAATDAAAYAAAYAAAAAARKIHYSKCAKKLIEILKETN